MIRYFAGHPTISNLLMILLLLAGAFTAPTLLRETFPRSAPNEVEITVAYPGARPEEVESAICDRIENALDAVTGIDRQSCESRENLARALVKMNEGENFQAFVADVSSEIDGISDFPDRADSPRVRALGLTDFVASVSISGPKDRGELRDYAEDIRTNMLRWGGIPRVTVRGFPTREIRVELNPTALRKFGLSVSDVARVIDLESLDLPAGTIETKAETFLIRVAQERRDLNGLADLIVRSGATGGHVRLGEIATIRDGFTDDDSIIVYNGKLAAVLDITKTRAEDSLRIVDEIHAFLDEERQKSPPGLIMTVTTDAAAVVKDRLMMVLVNGVQGLALVFLVLWLFFGFRFSFWVAMGLPVSFMGGLALMSAVGYSLNLMTTLGLLIVIGLLMDDAIVIAENIARLRAKGESPLDAATKGASQVFTNVLASFATTAMVFGSLAFLAGDLGAVLRVVPVVMLFVLLVSLVEAFLILPHHLEKALEKQQEPGKIQRAMDRLMDFMRDSIVGPVVDLAIRFRYFTAGISFAILLVAVAMLAGGFIKFTAFPELDGDTIVARVLLPQGTPISRTQDIVKQLENGLDQVNNKYAPEQPDHADLIQHVTVFYGENRDAFETGPHVVTVNVDLLPSNIRTVRPDAIMADWREIVGAVPDVISLKYAEASIGPSGIAIDLRLKGDDLAELKAASIELQDWIWKFEGVTSVLDDLRPGKREMQITMKDVADTLGISSAMVADQLRSAYFGTTISELLINGQLVELNAQFSEPENGSYDVFDDFVITRPDGSYVLLKNVADISIGQGYNRINHEDGRRTVTVQGAIDTRIANANALVNNILGNFVPTLLEKYPNISIDVEGQNAEATKTQKSMVKGFAIGLIGVFLLLSFMFRSYIEPIIVMLIIPLSLIGSIFGHMAMGLDFSMPSMLGFVALAGVVVNNSIILVDFIKHEHDVKTGVTVAAAKAARVRFRAIFLTSTTTIVGLMPILLETSLQAQILIPLVASLSFGLLSASVIVLFVLPAIYAILDDLGVSTLSEEVE